MNKRAIFITSLLLALLLHMGSGYIMVRDEKSRIVEYQQQDNALPIDMIQLMPEALFPTPPSPENEPENDSEPESDPDSSEEKAPEEEREDAQEEGIEDAIEEEETKTQAEPKEADEALKAQEAEQEAQAPSYQQNLSKGGDLLRENILPPRKEGEYRRTVSNDIDPYQQLRENALALLADTPFFDKEWKDTPQGEEDPTYYSSEFVQLLQKFNPTEPINQEELPETDEAPAPEEAEVSDSNQFGTNEPVTLIVNRILPPVDQSLLDEIAKKEEATKERSISTNMMNAAGSQIRRLEYNVALASSECFSNHIRGSNRRYQVAVMIFEEPRRTGVFRSSGNPGLDECVVKMTNELIQIPAEMERIRDYAPRMGDAYLLNASF